MRSKEQWERELRFWIDCLVEDMGDKYGAQLTDENRMERRMKDIELRESLIEHVAQIVRCSKISERFWHESRSLRSYRLVASVSHEGASTSFIQ